MRVKFTYLVLDNGVMGLILALILTSCGSVTTVHPELMAHVQAFEECSGKPVTVTEVTFDDRFDDTLGYCKQETIAGAKVSLVRLDRSTWASLGPAQRRAVVFHELLHCEHGLDDLYSERDRYDLMFYRGMTETDTIQHWDANVLKYCANLPR